MPNQYLINKLKVFFATEKAFFKNVTIVFSSKVYIAVLSLLLTPIIARLFTPEDYGEYGLFNAAVKNLVVIGTLSLPLAISTAKKRGINNVFNLSLTVIFAFTLLFSILLFFFNSSIDRLFETTLFSTYWYIILIGFALTSVSASLISVNIRLQRFKTNATTGIIEGNSTKGLNLGLGWIGLNSLGLILSDVISKAIGLITLLKNLPKEIKLKVPSYSETIDLLKNHKAFPTYIMPSQWIGMLNNQLIILVVAFLFSKNELGQLVMAIGLLGIPLHIITNTFQPVITERLSSLEGKANSKTFFKRTAMLLFLISSILFTGILVLPSETFTFILGNQWVGIKPIINMISLYYIIVLIDQSFENGFIVIKKQKIFFYFSIFELAIQSTIIGLAYAVELPLVQVIIFIAVARSLVSFIRVSYLWKKIKPSNIEL